ncbi:MAG: lactate utilization protein C [Alphaproteobacteria bacterium]|jgi:L-lactate dehydrogenase complex protein LldG|nr:lactate utilization protein C [Alphaproteobacteria bacterium]
MNRARRDILDGIRRGLRGGRAPDPEMLAAVDERLARHPRDLIPARVDLPPDRLVTLFMEKAEAMAATVGRVADVSGIPGDIAAYLAGHNLPPEIKIAPDPALTGLPWESRPTLTVKSGAAQDGDVVGVAMALAGIAETGTLMLHSGRHGPTTLNFLPDNHIVVLRRSAIVGPYEDAWDRVRAAGALPRTVNLITGPSRTGDIEQTIQLGAHGPRRLHIVLVDGD